MNADDLEAIRRGLAAQLRVALPTASGMVCPFPLDSPEPPVLLVSHIEKMDPLDFDGGRTMDWIIEALLPATLDQQQARLLDGLVFDVADALDADATLTSRLQDNGTVLSAQGPACDAAVFKEYRGASRVTIGNGTQVLQAIWVATVVA